MHGHDEEVLLHCTAGTSPSPHTTHLLLPKVPPKGHDLMFIEQALGERADQSVEGAVLQVARTTGIRLVKPLLDGSKLGLHWPSQLGEDEGHIGMGELEERGRGGGRGGGRGKGEKGGGDE